MQSEIEIWDVATAPYEPGMYNLLFQINPDFTLTEIQYLNNTSSPVSVEIEPDYEGIAMVDAATFLQGSSIEITGSSIRDGAPYPNAELEVYIITENTLRREIVVTTDENGDYSTTFEPLPNESGDYIVGASFPGLNATDVQDEFDILGVKINNNNYLIWEILLGETLNGTISVENLSSTPLNNVTIGSVSLPSGVTLSFESIPTLAGNSSFEVPFQLTGTEVSPIGNYQEIPLIVSSDENASEELIAYYFCQAQQGYISSDVAVINRTISQTESNQLELRIFNNGEGATGDISVELPEVGFMSLITLPIMPSIEPGEEALVIIEFIPSPDLPLNTPASGTIVINTTNANYLTIPYTIEKVSDETGGLIVDVIDQYTYFTEDAPHVENAYVEIRHYFTGEVYASGYTDADGLFAADALPEGVLRLVVQAESHDGYNNAITILPGTTITETVFLNYQAISFTWQVEPTEIEDSYQIDLVMNFETNVPVPVVTIEVPDSMPQLFGSETYNFYATLTNHGLITANDVELNFPTNDPEYEFITNYTPTDLLAQQAIQVPVLMKRRDSEGLIGQNQFDNIGSISEFLGMEQSQYSGLENVSLSGNCSDFAFTAYWYYCGGNGLWQQGGELFNYEGRICSGPPGGGWDWGGGGGGGGTFNPCPGCPGGGGGPGNYTPPVYEQSSCQECLIDIALAGGGCFPPTSVGAGVASCVEDFAFDGGITIGNAVGCGLGFVPILGCALGIIEAFETCFTTSVGSGFQDDWSSFTSSSTDYIPPIVEQAVEDIYQATLAYEARLAWLEQFFGDLTYNDNIAEFTAVVAPFVDNQLPISEIDADEIYTAMQGYDIAAFDINAFIVRWNQTVEAWDNGVFSPNATYPNIVDQDSLSIHVEQIQEVNDYALNRGYQSVEDMHTESVDAILEQTDEAQSGVCSSVTIQISQELTMTREAFEGTLGVSNGHPTGMIDSLYLNLEILNPDGVLSNDLFEIQPIGFNQLTNIDGTGQLAAQSEGTASILFIPEPAAAPTVPISYSFGGTISYLDPFTGLMVTVPLIPAVLQVNPSPDLYLHYFMQRDIYGDDPLTSSVEPILPADLAVMIENNGYGTARGVVIESAQPEIVGNEDGLAINFSLIGSNLQGEPATLGLTNITFGDIDPLSTKIGQWYFTSTLLGHFISYETNLVHLSSYGNPDLSLISGVELHELIQTVSVYTQEDGIDDFLVNEIQDANETPDAIYLSQGNLIYDVFEAQNGFFTGNILAAGNTTTLHVDPSAQGWNYIKLDDPGNGNFEILSVTRNSDGQEIPLKNAWLTHVTLPDSQEPVYEDKFHFVDDFDTFDEVMYTVVWSPKDPNPPFVVDINGAPTQVSSDQVTNLTVTFSEDIIDSSFEVDDLMLTFQGGADIADNSIVITEIDSVTYDIDISALTTGNGYYVFTTQAAGIQDMTGTFGLVGEQVSWTQFLSVPAIQQFIGVPENNISNAYDQLDVLFNMPLDISTVTADRFTIYDENGMEQNGTLTITPYNVDNTLFRLTGLGSFINLDGEYLLEIDLTGIRSADNVFGLAIQPLTLILDTAAPELVNLLRFNDSGLDAQHYTGMTMNFDEAIIPVDTSALELWWDGIELDISDVPVNIVNDTWYEMESFEQLTYPDGDYVFRVDMAKVADLAGNVGTGIEETAWTVNRASSMAISNISISPDMGYSSSDAITATKDLSVSFTINEYAQVIEVYQVDNGVYTLIATLSDVSAGPVSIPTLFDTGGNTALSISVTDDNANIVSQELPIYIDESALTGTWNFEAEQTLTAHPNTMEFVFSDQLLSDAALDETLVLLFNNSVISAAGLNVDIASGTTYQITGFESVNILPGTYSLGIDMTLVNKYSSGIAGNDVNYITWQIEEGSNALPIADAGQDITVTSPTTYMLDASNSFDPDGDPLTFQWYPPTGITLDDENSPTPSFSITEANDGEELSFLLSVSDGFAASTDIVTITIDMTDTRLDAKLLLQGAYEGNGIMNTILNDGDLLSDMQPYNTAPWNYSGSENVSTMPSDVVDWVLLTVRTELDNTTVIDTIAALLQDNGQLVAPNGSLPGLSLEGSVDSVYIAIYHRNHVGLMTAEKIAINNGVLTVDFTQSSSVAYGNINGISDLTDGYFGMFSGDADGNGQVQNSDLNAIFPIIGLPGYRPEDINLNGEVQNSDIQSYVYPNIGRGASFEY